MQTQIQRLETRHAALVAEAGGLLDAVEREARTLTTAEETRHAELVDEIANMTTRLTNAKRDQAQTAEIERLTGDMRPAEQRAIVAPTETAVRGFIPSRREYRDALMETRAGGEDVAAEGGYIVPKPIYAKFFDHLRAKSVVLEAGPLVLPMTSRTLSLPVIGASVTADTYAENTEIVSSDLTFAASTLTARKIAALARGSNEWFSDSNPAARDVLAYDMARQLAKELDTQFLAGSGTPPDMRGMLNFSGVTSTTAAITLAGIAAAIGRIEADNGTPSAIFMDPATWTTLVATAATDGRSMIQPDPTADRKRQLYRRAGLHHQRPACGPGGDRGHEPDRDRAPAGGDPEVR